MGTSAVSRMSSSAEGKKPSSSSGAGGRGDGSRVSRVLVFLGTGSGAGERALALRRPPDLSTLEVWGAGAGMLLSTSPRRFERKSSSSFVLTT